MRATASAGYEVVLKPRKGWQPVDCREIWRYRDLLAILVMRDIRIRYKQTLLGGLWAVLQPLLGMVIFSLFFNKLAGIQSGGPPYPLFSFTGLVLWTFFTNSVSMSSNSLVGNQSLVSKIYFPRVFIPMASVLALLLDVAVCLLLLIVMLFAYGWPVRPGFLLVPLYVFGSLLAASGLGLFFSALNVRFRDVKYAVPFLIQMALFVTPVIYPASYVPPAYRLFLALNPMAGMIEGFRAATFGSAPNWDLVIISGVFCFLLFVAGLFFFRRQERFFADII